MILREGTAPDAPDQRVEGGARAGGGGRGRAQETEEGTRCENRGGRGIAA